ncbi:hypothetical protein [Deinococcus sp. UR1]|uniref:hypothetical protein n=1 Tax=Deinococcus sp. UR1 TaxID=1704277 RepID=UPI0011AF3110|nr:hypothetical protein [Deinococcus sp. UR1]
MPSPDPARTFRVRYARRSITVQTSRARVLVERLCAELGLPHSSAASVTRQLFRGHAISTPHLRAHELL